MFVALALLLGGLSVAFARFAAVTKQAPMKNLLFAAVSLIAAVGTIVVIMTTQLTSIILIIVWSVVALIWLIAIHVAQRATDKPAKPIPANQRRDG